MSFRIGDVVFDDGRGFAIKDALRYRLGAEQMALLRAFAQHGGQLTDQQTLERQWRDAGGAALDGAEIMASMEDALHPILETQPLFKTAVGGQVELTAPVQMMEPGSDSGYKPSLPAVIAWGIIGILALIEAYFVFFEPSRQAGNGTLDELPVIVSPISASDPEVAQMLQNLSRELAYLNKAPLSDSRAEGRFLHITGRVTKSEIQAQSALSLKLTQQPDDRLIWAGFYPIENQDEALLIKWILADISLYLPE